MTTDLIETLSSAEGLPYPGNFHVDKNILAQFPAKTKIQSATRFGISSWAVTARVNVVLSNGSEARYFVKTVVGSHGRVMVEGEFNSMTEMHKLAPGLVPKPHSWGRYAAPEPQTYFFIAEFIEMSHEMPDPEQLCSRLARFHLESRSPSGDFGFHITNCVGRVPQTVAWEKSWTVFFARLMEHVLKLDAESNGTWQELDILSRRLLSHVIPRLLDALESDGRKVKPSLIHGDLWEGNIGTSVKGGGICLFDAGTLYAHNEMEIGNWRGNWNRISDPVYTETYNLHYPKSEPVDEWDDRNRLYSTYYNILFSTNHLGEGKAIRQRAYIDIYYLIDKFAPFTEELGPRRLEKHEVVSLSSERDHTKAVALS
ncbi:hypothetical protein ACHAQA_008849 [Verticillium albo-atrum]